MNRAVEIVRRHLKEQYFPLRCSCCGKEYATLCDYIAETTPIGRPVSYDLDIGTIRLGQMLGVMAMANCSCGSTLALSSKGLSKVVQLQLLGWALFEARRRSIPISDLLQIIREEIRMRELSQK